MTSILTNNAATAALQTLRSISQNMAAAQDRISSGARVGSAKGNAAYWAISTMMKSDTGALSAISDALGLGAAKVDTAYAGMDAAIKVVEQIKAKVVAAKEEGVDRAKIQEEIVQLRDQLISIGKGSSFNGENWLVNSQSDKSVVSGFVRDSNGNVTVNTTTYSLDTNSVLFEIDEDTGEIGTDSFGILNSTDADDFNEDFTQVAILALDVNVGVDELDSLDDALASVEWALDKMTIAGAKLGSMSKRIDLQSDFADKLNDALTKGIGRLIDADMNEESTRLKALQTQQQLAIQALAIANSDSQNILSLFR